ncbi:MAG TPA: alpha/beta hydrolase [Actinomycetaceae bacterium]|nr:alpha/beta hydrolase [Actinomycetaceae bacterium]
MGPPERIRKSLPKRLLSKILGLFAAPRINMKEDYEKIRLAQRVLTWMPEDPEHIIDQIVLADDGYEIPVRLFLPKSDEVKPGVLLFFHGGGWVIGDIDTYGPTCRTMADVTGRLVCSVGYRLAPENPYPIGLNDCLRVTETLLETPSLADVYGPEDVTLIGDSAGGNLVAAVTLALRERGRTLPGAQILLYPLVQWDHDPETSPFPSVAEYGTGLRLTSEEVNAFRDMYQPDPSTHTSPYIAPLAADDLSGLPRTLVITAEMDLLRDEGEAFGLALRAAGTPARVERIDDTIHGFITLPRIVRPVTEAYEAITSFLDGDMEDSRVLEAPPVVVPEPDSGAEGADT